MMTLHRLSPLVTTSDTGCFGGDGGEIDHPNLKRAIDEPRVGFTQVIQDPEFMNEVQRLREDFVGRPSPIYHARRLSANGS